MTRPVAVALLLAALAVPAAADTYLIDDDGGPGVSFTDLPPAIAAALPGDVLLVRDGTYSSFVLQKGLAIVADTGHAPTLGGGYAWIHDVPAGQSAAVAGLTMGLLRIQNCADLVRIDACDVQGAVDWPAFTVLSCDLVVVSRTHTRGASGTQEDPIFPAHNAQRGADLRQSTVLLSECRIEGGNGGVKYKWDGKHGEPGLYAQFATVVLQASSVFGGGGGFGWKINGEIWAANGGDGAPGVQLLSSSLKLFGAAGDVIAGGPGGEPNIGNYGASAVALFADNSSVHWSGVSFVTDPGGIIVPVPDFGGSGSTITEVSPAVPVLTTGGSGQLGDSLSLELNGPASAPFLLWVSPLPALLTIGAKPMPLLLDAGALVPLWTGALDAGGEASLTLAIPALPGLNALPVHLQAWVAPAAGPSGPSTSASLILR